VTTERWRHPAPGKCRVIHIDIDSDVVGVSYFPDAALIGDAKLALANLTDAVKKADADALALAKGIVSRSKAARRARLDQLADSMERPIRPERLVRSLNRLLPNDAVLVLDPGTPCPYFTAYYDLATPGRHIVTNRAHGALGYSLPGVVGAQFARPNSKCVAVMGDGSFGFSVGEMETIVRYQLPITLVVVANSTYGWIKAGQKTSFGERYYSVDFTMSEHARIGEAFGLKSWRVEDPGALDQVLREAIAFDGPTLVEVVSQPLHEAAAPVSEWIA
jgi:acetolactate synthase-1/2/3 large subunit